MSRRGGSAFQPSRAPVNALRLNNLPGAYPVEAWRARYWSVTPEGRPEERSVDIELPAGYGANMPSVRTGQPGCIVRVRAWGLMCAPDLLNDIGFDATPLLTHDRARFPGGEDQEWMHLYYVATTFDLPGYFIIGDREHEFRLYDPAGRVKGSWISGPTYLGALTWIVTRGEVCADFVHLQDQDFNLYRRAVAEMLSALPGAADLGYDGFIGGAGR
jgi:hypothetical protein